VGVEEEVMLLEDFMEVEEELEDLEVHIQEDPVVEHLLNLL
jgi:hypothetical protein